MPTCNHYIAAKLCECFTTSGPYHILTSSSSSCNLVIMWKYSTTFTCVSLSHTLY